MPPFFQPQLWILAALTWTAIGAFSEEMDDSLKYPAFAFNPWTTGDLVPGYYSKPTCYATSSGSNQTIILVGSACTPAIPDGFSSSSSSDGFRPVNSPMLQGMMVAVDAGSGKTVWTTPLPSPPIWTWVAPSPAVDQGQGKLFVATNESLIVLMVATGLELWNFTFPAGYGLPDSSTYAARTVPVWLDDHRRLLVFLERSGSRGSRLYVIDLASLEMSLVWDSLARHSGWDGRPVGPTGFWIRREGQISVVQRFSSGTGLAFLTLHFTLTNTSDAVEQLHEHPDINSTLVSRNSPVAVNHTFFFAGMNTTTGEAVLIAYRTDAGSAEFSVAFSFAAQVFEVIPFTLTDGSVQLALVAVKSLSNQSQVMVWTAHLNGTMTSEIRTQICQVASQLLTADNAALYLYDQSLKLAKYSFGDANWSWIAASIFEDPAPFHIQAAILHGSSLYFHSPLPLALTAYYESYGALLQVDSVTGVYIGVLPTPLTWNQDPPSDSADAFLGLVFDSVSFNGSVVGIAAASYPPITYLTSMLPPSRGQPTSTIGFDKVISLPQALGTPHYHDATNHVVYYTSSGIVYAFDTRIGALLWSYAVPDSNDAGFASGNQPAPLAVDRLLYLAWQAGPDTFQILILSLSATGAPPTLRVWNATIPGRGICVPSLPRQFLVDPTDHGNTSNESKWIYFIGTGPASYCLWRFRMNPHSGEPNSTSLTWEMVPAANNNTVLPPVFGVNYVWFNDVTGTIYRQNKNDFSSADAPNRLVSPMTTPFNQIVSPLSMEEEFLLFAVDNSLFVYNALNLQLWSTTPLSVGTTPAQNALAPQISQGAVFVGCTSGIMESFDLTNLTTPNTPLPLRFSRISSVVPPLLISSWGLLISTPSVGVAWLDWSGSRELSVEMTPTGSLLGPCSVANTFYGPFIFAVCRGQLHVVDTIRGEVVLSGPTLPVEEYEMSFVVDLDHSDSTVQGRDPFGTVSLPNPTVLFQIGSLIVAGNISQSLLPPALPTPPPHAPVPSPTPVPPSASVPDSSTGKWIGLGIGCGVVLLLGLTAVVSLLSKTSSYCFACALNWYLLKHHTCCRLSKLQSDFDGRKP